MSSTTQEDGFTKVTHKHKKRKANGSPTLPSMPKPGFPEPPLGASVSPKQTLRTGFRGDTQWCRQKIQKLEIFNGQIEAVPPQPQSISDQGITKR